MPTTPSLSVVALPVPPYIRHALISAGLSSVADLRRLNATELIQVTGLAPDDAAEVLQLALQQAAPGWRLAGATTAFELLSNCTAAPGTTSSRATASNRHRKISTGCAALDALLGGGVACGTVTEFFGVPGVGKTQLGMQLVVNTQRPALLGGLGGKAMYIDTEGSFMTDRLIDMATAAVQQVRQQAAAAAQGAVNAAQQAAVTAQAQSFSVDSVLSNTLHFRVQHHAQQLALVRSLELLLQSNPQVLLVVIDSITFHFRQDFPDAAQRARLMTSMAQQLAAAAEQHGVAVVMMNQVVTRIADSNQGGSLSSSSGGGSIAPTAAWLAPALGEGWGQAAACRVALFWEGTQRYALLAKAKEVPQVLQGQVQQQGWQRQRQVQLCVPYYVHAAGIS